ncbi:MAG: 50S ribosomal protein L24 [Ignavibacteriae bacterium HGW-Ignavibacteriae-2]|nr:MAG: 50S ribosomal protein L24 [Ignavibacteriae bacterium HGW-Ignavibacteriae-2]
MLDMRIKKDDNVVVVAGNSKGKTGKVLKVFPKVERIIVEGVNIRKRHTKPNQANPQGGIIEKEAPIHVSNVMVVDPKSSEPTRIGKKIIIDEKSGKKRSVRVSKSSGEML